MSSEQLNDASKQFKVAIENQHGVDLLGMATFAIAANDKGQPMGITVSNLPVSFYADPTNYLMLIQHVLHWSLEMNRKHRDRR